MGRGGEGGAAYPLTKQHFQLKNDIFAIKFGNNVDCYLLLPCLLGYGKRLPAYQTHSYFENEEIILNLVSLNTKRVQCSAISKRVKCYAITFTVVVLPL